MTDWSMKLDRTIGRISTHDDGYLYGVVITRDGVVDVYSQGGEDGMVPSTTMTFAMAGRMYSRTFKKRYSKRGLATVAARFAAEIAEGQP
jgi:hypothetical protein